MSMIQEFKQFIMRGNVIDLAVGIIIGAAFGKIVTSFVNDIIMPPIGLLIGGMDFSNLTLVLKEAVEEAPEVAIKYGTFINNILDFLIVGAAIFLVIKSINAFKKKEEEKPVAPPAPSNQEVLLAEIRDLLKSK